jgi:NAD(P)H-flavin reductase
MNENPMLPYLGKLVEVRDLAAEIKLFRVEMLNGGGEAFRTFQPGQFAFVSASPTRPSAGRRLISR